ncbi:hypothetical protein [Clostridium sp.]|uniref:hypothetical protein n=1 Tax=Clostridium sp. TaxID=1506 RepID=UPI001A5419E3|nr:hypothetical protein [Clostridium sp.]MBK5242238.1 hypothetical protein [Clostridium sp.]
MRKPSIFSKDYEKQIKKRRKKIFLMIIVPIIGLSIFLITDFNSVLNKAISMKESINNIFVNKSKQDTNDEGNKAADVQKKEEILKEQPSKQESEVDKTIAIENEIFAITLSDGQEISIKYNVVAAEKSIEGISDSKDISYDISPSKKSVVIQSKLNQDILYFDVNKSSKDITKESHTSSKGKVFYKEDKIKEEPNYVWSITPKFIDEDNIVYVSELPWMNKEATQYIWKVNLKRNIHSQVKPVKGKSITFKNITSKGLETIIDGNVVYVTSKGEILN